MAHCQHPKARHAVTRLLRLAIRLGEGKTVTVAHIMEAHGVSLATAKRDMTFLESILPLIRERIPGDENGRTHLRLMRGTSLVPLLQSEAS